MSWTYSWDQLTSNLVYQVRFLIGDTFSADPQMQDEEIAFQLTRRSTVYGAAAECCRYLASKMSRSVDTGVGSTKVSYSQLSKQYLRQALQFEQKAAKAGAGTPYAGGISVADMIAQQQNSDRVTPAFTIGQNDDLLPVPPVGTETEVGGESGESESE